MSALAQSMKRSAQNAQHEGHGQSGTVVFVWKSVQFGLSSARPAARPSPIRCVICSRQGASSRHSLEFIANIFSLPDAPETANPDYIRSISFDVDNHFEKLESAKALDAKDIKDNEKIAGVISVLYPPKTPDVEHRTSFGKARAILLDQNIPFHFRFTDDQEKAFSGAD